jgi:hypothetical protein
VAKSPKSPTSSGSSGRSKVWWIAGVATLVIAGGVWGAVAWWGHAKGATVALPKELQFDSLKAQAEEPEKMAQTMHDMREREDLTEEQRHAAFENMRRVWETELDQRIDEYYAAPEAEKTAVLDRQIDEFTERMERMRQVHEQDRQANQRGEGEARGDREATSRPRRDWRQRMAEMSVQERKTRSESRNPDQTARHMAYFAAVRQRMEQRGIQMPRGPGGGFGRGGGGPPRGGRP